jgi:hypothetical protein
MPPMYGAGLHLAPSFIPFPRCVVGVGSRISRNLGRVLWDPRVARGDSLKVAPGTPVQLTCGLNRTKDKDTPTSVPTTRTRVAASHARQVGLVRPGAKLTGNDGIATHEKFWIQDNGGLPASLEGRPRLRVSRPRCPPRSARSMSFFRAASRLSARVHLSHPPLNHLWCFALGAGLRA